jgi:DICT domain-containing protein
LSCAKHRREPKVFTFSVTPNRKGTDPNCRRLYGLWPSPSQVDHDIDRSSVQLLNQRVLRRLDDFHTGTRQAAWRNVEYAVTPHRVEDDTEPPKGKLTHRVFGGRHVEDDNALDASRALQ